MARGGLRGLSADRVPDPRQSSRRGGRRPGGVSAGLEVPPWLYRVVVNTCNSNLRKEIPHRDRRSGDDDLSTIAAIDDPVGRIAQSNDVAEALKDLPAHLRIVVVLRYYSDLSERDIAVIIGRQPGTVKSRLNEARRRLAAHPALRQDVSSDTTLSKETHQ
jgi:RNA polymerase sigma factor (sigma-70 family)